MQGVILGICPTARIVDLSHAVGAQDVAGGALVLYRAVPYFPPGTVHVAVVDPGVGSARRALLLVTADGLFVGPDNGLFTYVLRAAVARAVGWPERTGGACRLGPRPGPGRRACRQPTRPACPRLTRWRTRPTGDRPAAPRSTDGTCSRPSPRTLPPGCPRYGRPTPPPHPACPAPRRDAGGDCGRDPGPHHRR